MTEHRNLKTRGASGVSGSAELLLCFTMAIKSEGLMWVKKSLIIINA